MAQSRNTMDIATDDLTFQAATADGMATQETTGFYAKVNEVISDINIRDQRLKRIDSTLTCIVIQLKKTVDGISACENILATTPIDFSAFNSMIADVKNDYYHLKQLRREQYDKNLDIAPSDEPVRVQLTNLKNDLQQINFSSHRSERNKASSLCDELEDKLNHLYGSKFENMCHRQEQMLDALDQCQTNFYSMVDKANTLAKKYLDEI